MSVGKILTDFIVKAAIPLLRVLDSARDRASELRLQKHLADFQCIGEDVSVHASVMITQPRAVAIGNNVHIGADTYIMSQGGLQIRDNVHISRRVTIYCSEHAFNNEGAVPYGPKRVWKQVIIGRNAWIGMNACILPGVTIGEGAIIGIGAVISEDVPPLAIVGQQPYRVIGERDSASYIEAETARNYGGKNGAIVPSERQQAFPKLGKTRYPDICFILTTGRSGSTTIANILGNHSRIRARHEPRLQLIQWSTEYAHGTISKDEARELLGELFLEGTVYRQGQVYLESDQKYFNFIPILGELFPSAKFIWLTRSAFNVVSSTVGRSWYADPSHPVWNKIPWYFHEYRIQGDKTGSISESEWAQMTPFEKNCWYWTYVNSVIERDISAIPADRKLFLRLEDFASQSANVLRFLEVDELRLPYSVRNEAFYQRFDPGVWTQKERRAFDKLCGPMMAHLYPP